MGVGIAVSQNQNHNNPNSSSKKNSLKIIADQIYNYFNVKDTPGYGKWFFRNDSTLLWLDYEQNSVKYDSSNANKVDAVIDVGKGHDYLKKLPIKLDWQDKPGKKEVLWKQITSQINNKDYYVYKTGLPLTGEKIKTYIDNLLLSDKEIWYDQTNNKITFKVTDVKLNNDKWFDVNLKPSPSKGENKDILIVIKWTKKDDVNGDDIYYPIEAAGYSTKTPVFVGNVVKKIVNDYLANKIWIIRNDNQTSYKFKSTKAVMGKDFKWTVTLDEDTSLKTRNLDFKPFDIILDWKDQNDANSRLSEINTQIESKNYGRFLISADKVLNLFTNFIASGTWKFTYGPVDPQIVHIKIDKKGDHPTGITDKPLKKVWGVYIIFGYYNELGWYSWMSKEVFLNWKITPFVENIKKDIVDELSNTGYPDVHLTYTPTLNK